jgi:hypothetical protein
MTVLARRRPRHLAQGQHLRYPAYIREHNVDVWSLLNNLPCHSRAYLRGAPNCVVNRVWPAGCMNGFQIAESPFVNHGVPLARDGC